MTSLRVPKWRHSERKREGTAERFFPTLMPCLLVVVIAVIAAWCVVLFGHDGPLIVSCGTLTTASDSYLDGSGRTFQKCTWHLGNGNRTRGETYGLKVGRVFVSAAVRHINHRVTAKEANE